jgi:RNA recognition motif-containing protein
MEAQLFFSNIPYDCSDRELQEWLASQGVEVESIHIIRDLVSGVSPAFAYAVLKDHTLVNEAIAILNGKKIRTSTITVEQGYYRRVCAAGR